MSRCARAAPALLLHLNLWLAAYGGVALATALRLKWDPSTYVPLREVFPAEYHVLAGALCAAGAMLLMLAQLAAAAATARAPRTRRLLFIIYACATLALLVGELALCGWLARRTAAWLRSPAAALLLEALELKQHLRPLLHYFGRWHPLPQHINELIDATKATRSLVITVSLGMTDDSVKIVGKTTTVYETLKEATEDAPRNGYAALALALLLALLQPAAIALAAVAAAVQPAQDDQLAVDTIKHSYSWSSADSERAPLRTTYRNGRIVVL